jgi:hypothetical protein
MSKFTDFRDEVNKHLAIMSKSGLFVVELEKDELWDVYLDAFPPGTNEIEKERRSYDCQCCKQFIKNIGPLVTIIANQTVSVWDGIEGFDEFDVVSKAMSDLIHSREITKPFLFREAEIGVAQNIQLLEDGSTLPRDHFACTLDPAYVEDKEAIPTKTGARVEDRGVFMRSMEELTLDSAETVMELIQQNSLYRGEEHKQTVLNFIEHKATFDALPEEDRACFSWTTAHNLGHGGRFRNTVIGTLLTDISDGLELDKAVKRFEDKVAPVNYKRPTALVTKGMIAKAQAKVVELGLTEALPRRYAHIEDITINNVIFADRTEKKAMDPFAELGADIAVNTKKFDKVEKVSIDKFLADVVPTADSIELLLENKHVNSMMSVIAPQNADAPNMLKWGNNFSWTYQGEVTDSIKERVKQAGGDVFGHLRASLAWSNGDDLDLYVVQPNGITVWFGNSKDRDTGGNLDVDMNAGGGTNRKDPVENITWPQLSQIEEGTYRVEVKNYAKRETINTGFEIQLEWQGTTYDLSHPQDLGDNKRVVVATFDLNKLQSELNIKSNLEQSTKTKDVWGIGTQNFHRVRLIMNSPNHWDGEETGNKHFFFILEDCVNPDASRGLFNEFLKGELNEHRKVFEMLGAKMRVDSSDDQLSGVGFSSTQRNSVFCRVKGSSERTIEVTF